ncbi:MAG: isocitrate lyase/phosphoenolpyruvate mutase family protein [Alphaproteobacteria bacterium]
MTVSSAQREKTAAFNRMHTEGDVLLLPNCWDHASAALMAAAGFAAIATTSAGVAVANGAPDGENLSRAFQIGFAGGIANRTDLPVTADLEAGYGTEPEAVAATVAQAIAAGLVGCNIEDVVPGSGELMPFELAVARIEAGVAAARGAGVDFVLNARTDPYLVGHGDAEANFAEAVRRANAFLAAGAPSVYVPGVQDAATISRLVTTIDGPLNVHTVAGRAMPALAELRDLGVRRVSLGGSLMQAASTFVNATLAEIKAGDFGFAARAHSSRDLGGLMKPWLRR